MGCGKSKPKDKKRLGFVHVLQMVWPKLHKWAERKGAARRSPRHDKCSRREQQCKRINSSEVFFLKKKKKNKSSEPARLVGPTPQKCQIHRVLSARFVSNIRTDPHITGPGREEIQFCHQVVRGFAHTLIVSSYHVRSSILAPCSDELLFHRTHHHRPRAPGTGKHRPDGDFL